MIKIFEKKNKNKKVDKFFLTTILFLVIFGLAVFVSAALAKLNQDVKLFQSLLIGQILLGFGVGLLGMFFALKINYKFWRKYSFYIFIFTLIITAAVFTPLGWGHGGATRWLKIGPFSFQPVEFLKFGFIIYFAAWLAWIKGKVVDFKFGPLPFIIMLSLVAFVLIKQPDTKSLILITVTGVSMLFLSGANIKNIFLISIIALVFFSIVVYFTPYLQKRVKTFLSPHQDKQGSAWQVNQSIIAIGSGGLLGRGYGQSVQKFTYLPEAHGDSVFAVLSEEFGFVGSVTTIFLYLIFFLRGMRISNRSPDLFSRLLVAGIVIMITAQSFLHIASVIGVFPLTGVPLVFMSQGGTSLMVYLFALGIVLQISKLQIKN